MQGSVITTAGCLLRRKQRKRTSVYPSPGAALETEGDAAENVPAETVPAENVPVENCPGRDQENVPSRDCPPAGAAR